MGREGGRGGLEQEIWHVGAVDLWSEEPGRHLAGPTLGSSSAEGEGDQVTQDPMLGLEFTPPAFQSKLARSFPTFLILTEEKIPSSGPGSVAHFLFITQTNSLAGSIFD